DHPAAGEGFHHIMFAARACPALENLGQRRGVPGARRRSGKALVLLQFGLADDLRHSGEHLRVVGRDNEVDRLVRAVAGAADQVGIAAGRRAVAGATERLAVPQGRRELDPGQVQYRFLHRHLDELALAGAAALYESREDGDREVHPGPTVADVGAVEQRRPVGLAGHAHRAGGRLGHGLEALVGAVWAVGAEALDRGIHRARVQHFYRLVAQPEPLHHPGAEVFGDDIGLPDQAARDVLTLDSLQIDDDAALVAVEQQREIAVGRIVRRRPQPPRPVAVRGPLNLDHIGAEPGQHLGAGRPGLVVGEVDDADAFERLAHLLSPDCAVSFTLPAPPPRAGREGQIVLVWQEQMTYDRLHSLQRRAPLSWLEVRE